MQKKIKVIIDTNNYVSSTLKNVFVKRYFIYQLDMILKFIIPMNYLKNT